MDPRIDFMPSFCRHLPPEGGGVFVSVRFVPQGFEPSANSGSTNVFVLDGSLSMRSGGRIENARAGAASLLDKLGDNDHFTVIKFNSHATQVFPLTEEGTFTAPVPATTRNRRHARGAIAAIHATGGTRFSQALEAVLKVAELSLGSEVRTFFLTDGDNESDAKGDLDSTLARFLQARFRRPPQPARRLGILRRAPVEVLMPKNIPVHTIGVGPDPVIPELRLIGEFTGGPPPIAVTDARKLGGIFQDILAISRRVCLTNVRLHIWTPAAQGFGVQACQQTLPYVVDLHRFQEADPNDAQSVIIPIPDCDDQEREYLLTLGVPAGFVGSGSRLAGRFMLSYRYKGREYFAPVADQALQFGIEWTDDVTLSNQIPNVVLAALANIKVAGAIQAGISSYDGGNFAEASVHFELALKLADQSGRSEHVTRLLAPLIAQRRADGSVVIRTGVDRDTTNGIDSESSLSS